MIRQAAFGSIAILMLAGAVQAATTVSGELKQWHKVTLTFDGPSTSETATPNPFTDYRLNVTFSQGSTTYVVPGYYCADGNAAQTGASSGNKWRVHFAPDRTGIWSYSVSFRAGSNIAVSDDANAGSSAGYMDGATGTLSIAASDKTGNDNRAKGRLRYVNKHYLQYANGEYFIKGGADAPENLLAYADFDGNFKSDGISDNFIKTWDPHVQDWKSGDPTWMGGKGKGLIGAINYLAAKGMNVFSFLTMNINGDDKNVFPYTTYNERYRMDCSRLDQWEIVFEHGDKLGMYLHFKTQETENDQLLDGGALGTQRRLYYRELIARFSHHLALNWNLGEENTNTEAERKAFAQYFHDHDPYRHNVVLHTFPGEQDAVYTPLLGGNSKYTGVSLQIGPSSVHSETKKWVTNSANAGKPWVVANDEQGSAEAGVVPDANDYWHDTIRKQVLWGNLMANGGGVEYYFGYSYPNSDLTCQDFRSRDHMWDLTKLALGFFRQNLPFWEMQHNDGLTSNTGDYCLAKPGEIYAIYLPSGGTTNLDLGTATATFSVQWFDPRNGGALQNGSITQIAGPGSKAIGNAPNNTSSDWAVLVKRTGTVTTYQLTVASGTGSGSYTQGAVVSIAAHAPATGKVFDQWTGSVSTVANIYAASTTLTMPAASIAVTATYKDAPTGLAVTGFTLINADTDTELGPLANNATLNLAALPTRNLNVRADVIGTVASVKFGYDANASYRIENAAPFALAGDLSGDYHPWTPTLGAHILTATPYSATGATGTAGTALTANFTVVDQAVNTAPVIESAPWADPNPVTLPNGTTLNAMALDDGLPNPPAALTYTWSKVSGPGTVTFGAGNGTTGGYSCPAIFSAAGEYLLRVTVSDGSLSATGTVTVTVNAPANTPPTVSFKAPANGAIFTEGDGVSVEVNAADADGSIANVKLYVNGQFVRQENTAPYTWGPGQNDALLTGLVVGTYTLQAVATDNLGATTSASVQIAVSPVALNVTPTDDAYLENGARKNDTYLKVQPASPSRIAYLRFNVTGLYGAPKSATLALRVAGDPGNGTLRAYAGTHSNWTEATLTATNAPVKGIALGTSTGTMALDQTVRLDVKPLLTGDGAVTVILEMDAGGNDVWFSSKEGPIPPVLTVQP